MQWPGLWHFSFHFSQGTSHDIRHDKHNWNINHVVGGLCTLPTFPDRQHPMWSQNCGTGNRDTFASIRCWCLNFVQFLTINNTNSLTILCFTFILNVLFNLWCMWFDCRKAHTNFNTAEGQIAHHFMLLVSNWENQILDISLVVIDCDVGHSFSKLQTCLQLPLLRGQC